MRLLVSGGLYLRDGDEQNVDPEEYALVTSPCLHTIVVSHFSYNSFGYHDEAVNQMSQSTLLLDWSGLRFVVLISLQPRDGLEVRSLGTRLPWRGLLPSLPAPAWSSLPSPLHPETTQNIHRTGCLCSLTLLGFPELVGSSLPNFLSWDRHIDFSILVRLEIQNVTSDTLEVMTEMAKSGGLSSLDSLYLGVLGGWL